MDFWKENENIIDGNVDTLKLAYLIKKYGLPDDTELRTKILLNLNINNEDNYKIDYFKLCDCCDNFKNTYPFIEKVLPLIKDNISMKSNYIEEINQADISNEYKALLFFVLPLDN